MVRLELRGIVQGVGFRPFVLRVGRELGVRGGVRNRGAVVVVDLDGPRAAIDELVRRLLSEAPPGAVIDSLRATDAVEGATADGFVIFPSDAGQPADVFVAPDRRTCSSCLREHADPSDRRAGYPFVACAACGPRLAIIEEPPYDRARTAYARFPPCPACRAEYEDPASRRHHVEGIACPACGPRLRFFAAAGEADPSAAALGRARAALAAGQIGAIKGVGGYHLACDATNDAAVTRLREAKARGDKPFAVCVRDAAEAARHCRVSEEERALLESPAAPIVLLERLPDAREIAPAVAPGSPSLGIMTAYTALHVALVEGLSRPLVLTSANGTSEPMATTGEAARARLGDVADFFLDHDLDVAVRVDDSVTRVVSCGPSVLRLGRGLAPAAFDLPWHAAEPVLAAGGDLKNAFAFALGGRAIVGQHIGDLDHPRCLEDYERAIAHYERLLRCAPTVIAHDLHPDFHSTRHARDLAARTGAKLVPVQHHHAHVAATLTESGHRGPAIAAVFDGAGLGTDGAIWGGEVFVGDAARIERVAHLRYVPMPGGDLASRQGWRMALAHLADAELWDDPRARALLAGLAPEQALDIAARAARRGVNAPLTSSVGRLFDAVACLSGIQSTSSYEAQAPIELEWAAAPHPPCDPYPFALEADGDLETIDTRPLIRAVVREVIDRVSPGAIARRFHDTVAAFVVSIARRQRDRTGIETVALGGGVFANALLLAACAAQLGAAGFRVLRPMRLPCGDGGLCLGQLAVALAARST